MKTGNEKVNTSTGVVIILLIIVGVIVIAVAASNEKTTPSNPLPAPSALNSGASDPAYNLSEQVGVSLGDAQTIESIVSRRFTDPSIQQAVATDAAKLDIAGVGNATDLTNTLSDIVQGWAFTNGNDALVAMQDLYTASQSSAYDFNTFANIIVQAEPDLKASGMSFQDCVNGLASLSTQPGMTASAAQSAYLTIAADMNPANAQAYKALLKIPGAAADLKNKNFAQLLMDIESYFSKNAQ